MANRLFIRLTVSFVLAWSSYILEHVQHYKLLPTFMWGDWQKENSPQIKLTFHFNSSQYLK